MTSRAVPYHCPFCGDEDLWPYEDVTPAEQAEASGDQAEASGDRAQSRSGGWECRSCLRAFKVSMIKQLPRPAAMQATRAPSDREGTS